MGRFTATVGNVNAGPVRSIRPFGIPGARTSEFESLQVGWNPRSRAFWYEDFLVSETAGVLPKPMVLVDDSAAGAPTFIQRLDIANGVYRATLAATSEAENVGFNWGDQRMIPGNKAWWIEAQVNFAATLAANQSFVFGLASDYNANPDTITQSAWFRINGAASANLTLIVEGDDNTSDLSTTTTATLVAATPALLTIDGSDLGAVKFYFNDQLIGTLALPLLGATTLQPHFVLRKASGITTPTADIDYCFAEWDRS